ncbi:zinc-binding dehydrogenase [Rhodococcus sp. NCIMB 12038]|uniref:zinc-binding dehydrogenase n=1 Tax=Rhodococcus sp. NCIMB 12038 TaxID=933800 RepID=UPI000B3C1FE9|nr:zinc-binding dehydrogenase [Rhodococcus sp. NCIMB 12038]OUS92335.1 alcohol dehydrogenase [Rhodococcus sp. NCIMB 12038]
MSTARAAVLVGPDNVETWEVNVPEPAPTGVLVRVVVGGVCGSDAHIVTGDAGVMPFPIILGHEGVGRIEKLGADITTDYAGVPVEAGDVVYWAPIALCHRCYSCTILDNTPCENSRFFEKADLPNWGSYADFAWLPPGMAFFRVPNHVEPEALAALGCALPTALRGFEQAGGLRYNQSVIIQGAGPVGLSAVLVASLSGAGEIIVIDGNEKRLETARGLGATATVSLTESSAEQRIEDIYALTGPSGPDVVVEAAGILDAFPEGIDLVGQHGRYIVLGLWGAMGTIPVSPRLLTTKNVQINGATFPKPKHYYSTVQLVARCQDTVPLSSLVTHRFSIDDAGAALDAIRTGTVIKAVIDPSL